MSEPVIDCQGLTHAFGDGEARHVVLHDLAFAVPAGQFVTLVGASGSGKTTLLTVLGALRAAQSGRARVLGIDLKGAAEATRMALRRRFGFIFQAHNLHDSLTAEQNVRLAADVHGAVQAADQAVLHLLRALGLEGREHAKPANLSGGQKQRVAIARALVANPDIVFADEPTAALDRENADRIVALLRHLAHARGTTTLMVTHDHRIMDAADRVLVLDDGRIAEDRLNRPSGSNQSV
jgi:putative ABC transport system ATP-binding protein